MTSATRYGLTVMGNSGGEELVLCPFHKDNTPSAWFNPRKELFYCSVCGFGMTGMRLAVRLGIEVQVEEGGDPLSTPPPEDYDLVSETMAYNLGDATYSDYIDARGVLRGIASLYGLRWCNTLEAAVFPFYGLSKRLQGIAYRYANPVQGQPRYRVMGEPFPVWPTHFFDYGLLESKIVITEGAWSAMRLAEYAEEFGASLVFFALMGAKANRKIVDLLRPFDCTFLYDGDTAGDRACRRMRQLWPSAKSYTLSQSPDDMDEFTLDRLVTKLIDVQ